MIKKVIHTLQFEEVIHALNKVYKLNIPNDAKLDASYGRFNIMECIENKLKIKEA